jgi:UDP-2,3-diacylglucosamine pyrophosphatase LpxH
MLQCRPPTLALFRPAEMLYNESDTKDNPSSGWQGARPWQKPGPCLGRNHLDDPGSREEAVMLVIISDLHFEEEESRNIAGQGGDPPIEVQRNVQLKAFSKILSRLASQAKRDGARRLDLVLAGDIFEFHRTGLWFHDPTKDVRPYISTTEVDADLEARLLTILGAINRENSPPWKVMQTFRLLADEGKYLDQDGHRRKFPVPVANVRLYYIPGNHDRMANATPAIRATIRDLLCLSPGDAPFPHALVFDAEKALIRHGHEYDHLNFSRDNRQDEVLDQDVLDGAYHGATFGDFVTVDIASRISHEYRLYHGDDHILADPLLRTVYERILEFDDLRPQHAIPNFLLYIPGYTPQLIWNQALKPVLQILLDKIHDDPFLESWLERWDKKWRPDLIDLAQVALGLHIWDWKVWDQLGSSLDRVQGLSEKLIESYKKSSGPQAMAVRERPIRDGNLRFVVGGHTHKPAVELIGMRDIGEQYYVDTGTWRQQLPASTDYLSFGRVKALTHVVLYGPDEDQGTPPEAGKQVSLDYWTGVTQRWSAPADHNG